MVFFLSGSKLKKYLWQIPNVEGIDASEYLAKNESETKNANSENEKEDSDAKLDSSITIKITSTNFHTAKTKNNYQTSL